MLALVIDRETSSEISRINQEIGRSVYLWTPRRFSKSTQYDRLWQEWTSLTDEERRKEALGKDASYEKLLLEYTELKLYLHGLRKSCYWHGDPYAEREDIDVKYIFERCDELKQVIKEKRRTVRLAAWGGMEPEKTTPYDKPLLYAMDEYTCSHVVHLDEETTEICPLKGDHWYHGKPYCRGHIGETRRQVRMADRQKRQQRWLDYLSRTQNCDPGCTRAGRHVHRCGGVDDFTR